MFYKKAVDDSAFWLLVFKVYVSMGNKKIETINRCYV